MLKIANVTWKGRCGAHPRYDPDSEGEAGVRGGCPRCYALLAIHKQHRDLMRAVREFGASAERKRKITETLEDRQTSLFESI